MEEFKLLISLNNLRSKYLTTVARFGDLCKVGDGNTDRNCWQRSEDMTTDGRAYWVDVNNPGSDIAEEIAAAMVMASVVFRHSNPAYSNELLNPAKQAILTYLLNNYSFDATRKPCKCLLHLISRSEGCALGSQRFVLIFIIPRQC